MTEEDKVNTEFFLARMSSAVSKRCRSKMLEIYLRNPKNLLGPWRDDHIDVLIHNESFTYFTTIQEGFLRVGGHDSKLGCRSWLTQNLTNCAMISGGKTMEVQK